MTVTTHNILAVDLGKHKSVACVNNPAADFAFLEQHPIPSGGRSGRRAFGSWHHLRRSHRPRDRTPWITVAKAEGRKNCGKHGKNGPFRFATPHGVQARYRRVAPVTNKSGSARLFARESLKMRENRIRSGESRPCWNDQELSEDLL
jgi:hypothetical protein